VPTALYVAHGLPGAKGLALLGATAIFWYVSLAATMTGSVRLAFVLGLMLAG